MKKLLDLYHEYEEIINYVIVGGMTTVVSLATKYILLFTVLSSKNAMQLQMAVVISWIAAVSFAYVTNRVFVFKSKNKNIIKEIVSFFGSRVTTLLMEMLFMWFFCTLLGMNSKMWTIIWTIVIQVLIMVGNYLLSKLFVFKKS